MMLKTGRAILLAVTATALLVGGAAGAMAQTAKTTPGAASAGVSAGDFEASQSDFFFGADADFDMSLTPSEVNAQLRRGPSTFVNIAGSSIQYFDEDADGRISYDEFTAGAAAEFRRHDINGDGFITPDEN